MWKAPPAFAAWRHCDARQGFEVLFLQGGTDFCFHGCTTGVEAGEPWFVEYEITVDHAWHVRTARARVRSRVGSFETLIESTGAGQWSVNGVAAPHLDGCMDVDLESSAFTNTFPVHRLALDVGQSADAPAVYLRVPDARVERLEQHYERLPDADGHRRFHYNSQASNFECELRFDEAGLVVSYPGIAERVV